MPKGPRGEKRPADMISNAVHVMRIAAGEIEEPVSAIKTPMLSRLAHYNFVRVHKSLRTTPAMPAGVTDHLGELVILCRCYRIGKRHRICRDSYVMA
jgi:hypothetical protein